MLSMVCKTHFMVQQYTFEQIHAETQATVCPDASMRESFPGKEFKGHVCWWTALQNQKQKLILSSHTHYKNRVAAAKCLQIVSCKLNVTMYTPKCMDVGVQLSQKQVECHYLGRTAAADSGHHGVGIRSLLCFQLFLWSHHIIFHGAGWLFFRIAQQVLGNGDPTNCSKAAWQCVGPTTTGMQWPWLLDRIASCDSSMWWEPTGAWSMDVSRCP